MINLFSLSLTFCNDIRIKKLEFGRFKFYDVVRKHHDGDRDFVGEWSPQACFSMLSSISNLVNKV